MTKSYSLDLRQRVARLVEAGHSRHAAARYFEGLSQNSGVGRRIGQTGPVFRLC
jgi:hypothetical protein